MIAIVYGSSTLNTEYAAQRIHRALGESRSLLVNVKTVTMDLFRKYTGFVFMTSTWGTGDLQDDWEARIDEIVAHDFTGTRVALVALGDQENYPESFADSLAILDERMREAGATIVGATSTEGYTFRQSRAAQDGWFPGLVLDEDNQADRTEERIRNWVAIVGRELDPA